jgi:D-alanyl-D-alanine carboxypeptidase
MTAFPLQLTLVMIRIVIVFVVLVAGCTLVPGAVGSEDQRRVSTPTVAKKPTENTFTRESKQEVKATVAHGPRIQAILDSAVNEGLMAVTAYVSWTGGAWAGVAGTTSADSTEPLSPDSPFRLASVTKLFTATVILQLADENVLRLEDTLANHLIDGPAADIPHADLITIKMLLDHTSGIRNFSEINSFWREAYGNGGLDRIWQPGELIAYALTKKPYFNPGTPGKRHYSNSNYILLGMIIEKAGGTSLAEAYRRRIVEPLGMTHTLLEGYDDGMNRVQHSFLKKGFRSGVIAMKRGWHKAGSNGLYDVSGNYRLYNSWGWAAGGLSSTPGDLDRFLTGVRDGSLLSHENQEVLFQDNSAVGRTAVFFGGSGGWEGISTSAYEINHEIQIIVLVNSTGFDTDANVLRDRIFTSLTSQE